MPQPIPTLRIAFLAATIALSASCAFAFVDPAPDAHHADTWVGTWATAAQSSQNTANAFEQDTTLRQILHVSRGGTTLRVTFSNELGTTALQLGGSTVAIPAADGALQPTSALALTFSGKPSITIPSGGVAVSDPVAFPLKPLSDLAITTFVPAQTIPVLTGHELALETSYQSLGNQLNAPTLTAATKSPSWSFLKDIEVEAAPDATATTSATNAASAAIVAFGDSITDGWHATSGANSTWPDLLAARLQANPATRNLGVLNEGIGGNRVLREGRGSSALARFDRDVLAPAGVKYVILLEGINDIGNGTNPARPNDAVTADDLIAGFEQLARQAHTHGLKVIGATLTPYVGAGYATPAGEAIRQALNQWICTTKDLDGIIDFDQAVRNPANPSVFAPASDSGDHLHPNDAGFQVMSNAINLNLFTK